MLTVIIQSLLCVLIAVWGIAMVILGMIWENWTWAVLGIAVLSVGLPFVRNAACSTSLHQESTPSSLRPAALWLRADAVESGVKRGATGQNGLG